MRKYKIPFLWLIDRIAIVVALANAFIRIGNFFNSEIYGLPTRMPWGVEFVRDRLYDSATGELLPTVARHPTQLYEALSYLLIFIARFIIEFVKNDQVAFEAGMSLNMGQLLSLPFIVAGIGLLFWTNAKPRYFFQEQAI
jgi:prolipoprotein diacylglyceryltransferase